MQFIFEVEMMGESNHSEAKCLYMILSLEYRGAE